MKTLPLICANQRCRRVLGEATHLVHSVFCNTSCFEEYNRGRRLVRDVPSEASGKGASA